MCVCVWWRNGASWTQKMWYDCMTSCKWHSVFATLNRINSYCIDRQPNSENFKKPHSIELTMTLQLMMIFWIFYVRVHFLIGSLLPTLLWLAITVSSLHQIDVIESHCHVYRLRKRSPVFQSVETIFREMVRTTIEDRKTHFHYDDIKTDTNENWHCVEFARESNIQPMLRKKIWL